MGSHSRRLCRTEDQSPSSPGMASIASEPGPPRSKRSSNFQRFQRHWTDFCNVTSIHGVRYLVAKERPLFERLWWFIVLVISFYFTFRYAFALYFRWRNITVDRTSVTSYEAITDVPLPAFTFCNNMKSLKEQKSQEALWLLCGSEYVENGTYYEEVLNVDPPFNVTCTMYTNDTKASGKNFVSDCAKMFTRTATSFGVCYAFNMLDTNEVFRDDVISPMAPHNRTSDWDPEAGYKENAKYYDRNGTSEPFLEGPYPKRGKILIRTYFSHSSLFYGAYCPGDSAGIRVAVHRPDEMPPIDEKRNGWAKLFDENHKSAESFRNLEAFKRYEIDVYPEVDRASSSLQIFPPNQRKCYFAGERYLRFFKLYTKTNCDNECSVNKTLEICNCVDYYMPRINNTNVCRTHKELLCVSYAIDKVRRINNEDCNCYPPCNDLKYNTHYFATKALLRNGSANMIITEYMALDTFKMVETGQSEWTLIDLISSIGGIFSLFCGLSMIGLAEFAYYGTIRLATNFWRKRQKKISLSNLPICENDSKPQHINIKLYP